MAPRHYLNQCWNIVNWTLRNKLQWKFNRNSNIFIHKNAFESVVCEMAAILSRPQCVKFNHSLLMSISGNCGFHYFHGTYWAVVFIIVGPQTWHEFQNFTAFHWHKRLHKSFIKAFTTHASFLWSQQNTACMPYCQCSKWDAKWLA